MRLAYADPPYLGCARRHYRNDPSGLCAEVDHVELVVRLREFDAWALSCSTPSLGTLLSLAPEARVAAWVKPWCSFKPSQRVQYAWEPVLFVPCRARGSRDVLSTRDWLSCRSTTGQITHGAKPREFNAWVLNLLGYETGDEFYDVFPGSGSMGHELAQVRCL